MKLIKCSDYVIKQGQELCPASMDLSVAKCVSDWRKTLNYANFLKRPLELGFFIPCDLDGNVLEKPKRSDYIGKEMEFTKDELVERDLEQYQEALDRVLFEGFEYEEKEHYNILECNDFVITFSNPNGGSYNSFNEIWGDKTIEDLTELGLELTDSAIKQLN